MQQQPQQQTEIQNQNKQTNKRQANKQTQHQQLLQAAGNTCCKFMTCHNSCCLPLSLPAHLTLGCHDSTFAAFHFESQLDKFYFRNSFLWQLCVAGSSAQLSSAPIFNLQLEPESEPSSPIRKLTLSQFQSCQHNWGHLHVPNSQKKQVATATTRTALARNWEWQ